MTVADCLFRAARDKFDEGEFRGVLEFAREGLLHEEYHPGLLQMKGLAAYSLGELPEALEGFEAASMVAPLCPAARLALADVYLHFDKPQSAVACLRFLTEVGRCPTPLLPDLAKILGKAGLYRSALRICRRIIRLRGWFHPAHFGAAYYLAKLKGSPSKIIQHLRAAQVQAPQAIPYRVTLAGALSGVGEHIEACELIRMLPTSAIRCTVTIKQLQESAEITRDTELASRLRDRLKEISSRRNEDNGCFHPDTD